MLKILTEERKKNFNESYNKNYKKLLILPALFLLFSIVYLVVFSQQNGDIIKKDITLTGGTSIQIYSNTDINALKSTLTGKLVDFSIRQVSDLVTGDQLAVIIETRSSPEEAVPVIEDYLGYKLTSENSSIEFTGSTIGSGFYIQLMLAIILAFTFMGTVVFFIFSDKLKFKIILIILSLVAPTLFFFAKVITISQAFIISFLVIALIIYFSIKYSIPSFAVVLSAFADIIMTVAVVNLAGMEVSTAGIVAFLMLIGYSVDTDILLTTRVLKRRGESVNSKIYGSFLTGMTMTLTALAVVIVGFIITSTFSDVLKQIFTILAIGLFFDIVNTWVTNASMIKWYAESHKII